MGVPYAFIRISKIRFVMHMCISRVRFVYYIDSLSENSIRIKHVSHYVTYYIQYTRIVQLNRFHTIQNVIIVISYIYMYIYIYSISSHCEPPPFRRDRDNNNNNNIYSYQYQGGGNRRDVNYFVNDICTMNETNRVVCLFIFSNAFLPTPPT